MIHAHCMLLFHRQPVRKRKSSIFYTYRIMDPCSRHTPRLRSQHMQQRRQTQCRRTQTTHRCHNACFHMRCCMSCHSCSKRCCTDRSRSTQNRACVCNSLRQQGKQQPTATLWNFSCSRSKWFSRVSRRLFKLELEQFWIAWFLGDPTKYSLCT